MLTGCQDVSEKSILEVFEYKVTTHDNLSNYQLLVTICLNALEQFRDRNLVDFDALVGENGCHLRAWKIAHLANEFMRNPELALKLEDLIQKIKLIQQYFFEQSKSNEDVEKLNLHFKNLIGRKDKETLEKKDLFILAKDCFNEANAEYQQDAIERATHAFKCVRLDSDFQFIIYSYILTMTHDQTKHGFDSFGLPIKHESNPALLTKKFQASSSIAVKLLKVSQRNLAKASRVYIQEIAKGFSLEVLKDRLSERFIAFNHHSIPCGPIYYEFYALLLEAKRSGMYVAVKIRYEKKANERVNELILLYKGDGLEKPMVLLNLDSAVDLSKSAIILEGICGSSEETADRDKKVVAAFQKHGLEKIFLANAAQHGQYPKGVTPKLLTLDDDLGLKDYQSFAEAEGFSYNNPKTFLLKHVYCDIAANYFQ